MLRFVVLALTVVTVVLGKEYTLIQDEVAPLEGGEECASDCKSILETKVNTDLTSLVPVIILKDIFGICKECRVMGLDKMSVEGKTCSMKDSRFDQDVELTIPDFKIECTCTPPIDPFGVADKINKESTGKNKCAGSEPRQFEDASCESVKGDGGSGKATVVADLGNVVFNVRVKSEEGVTHPYEMKMTTEKEKIFSFKSEESDKLGNAFSCIEKNDEIIVRRVGLRIISMFIPCVIGEGANEFSKIVDEAFACKA